MPLPCAIPVIMYHYITVYQGNEEEILCLTLFCTQSLVSQKIQGALPDAMCVLLGALTLEWNHRAERTGLGWGITGSKVAQRAAWRWGLCLFLLMDEFPSSSPGRGEVHVPSERFQCSAASVYRSTRAGRCWGSSIRQAWPSNSLLLSCSTNLPSSSWTSFLSFF